LFFTYASTADGYAAVTKGLKRLQNLPESGTFQD